LDTPLLTVLYEIVVSVMLQAAALFTDASRVDDDLPHSTLVPTTPPGVRKLTTLPPDAVCKLEREEHEKSNPRGTRHSYRSLSWVSTLVRLYIYKLLRQQQQISVCIIRVGKTQMTSIS